MTSPYVVVEAGTEALDDARADLVSCGWTVVDGALGDGSRSGQVLAVVVSDADQAAAAVFAAIDGAGLLVDARPARAVIDTLCADLRRLGHLDHRVDAAGPFLTGEERAVLDLLADGTPLGEAANALHLSRRSADRRLAAARDKLGADSTAAAIAEYRRRLDRVPRSPS